MAAIRRADVSLGRRPLSRERRRQRHVQRAPSATCRSAGPPGPRRPDKTSPEELVAAAHASCFAMAFSVAPGQGRHPAASPSTSPPTVTFDKLDTGWTVHVVRPDRARRRARHGPGGLRRGRRGRPDGCPISRALKGNVELSVDATLEG